MIFHLSCLLLLFISIIDLSYEATEDFLTRPGDGEEFVYSPVDANATLHCAVNKPNLLWGIGEDSYVELASELTSRGIFFEISRRSDRITESTIIIMGNIDVNNDTRICCRLLSGVELRESCTTLIIYDRPSPPDNVTVQYNVEVSGSFNISWTATTMRGVDQNYFIYMDTLTVKTTKFYYIYHQNTSDSEVVCFAYITAVNGAGVSDPSNNVTIPSLPDIGPVTASLSHQVWKSADGEIMVNVSFKPALYCKKYPVVEYVLKLQSRKYRHAIDKFLGANETNVVLTAQDGILDHQKYMYTITANNMYGNATTSLGDMYFFTSDVQSVTSTVVGESTIDIQCLFIHGSDAVGCKVVLVSYHPGVNNETVSLMRENRYAISQLNLTLKAACYHKVLAYTIDVQNTTNNFYIEEILSSNNSRTNIECSGSSMAQPVPVAMIIIIILVIILFTVCLLVVVIGFILMKKRENGDYKSQDHGKNNCYVSEISTKYQPDKTKHSEKLTQIEAPPLQDAHPDEALERSSPSSHTHSPTKSPLDSVSNTNEQNPVPVVSTDSTTTPSLIVPLYAVPDMFKTKRELESNLKAENVKSDSVDNEENFYHVLENDVASSKGDVITSVPPAPELPPPPEAGSLLQALPEPKAQTMTTSMLSNEIVGGDLAATDDSIGGNHAAQAHTVPVYAVPDKVRLKIKSVLSQSIRDVTIQNESDEENNAEQEHVYHILENTKAPCKGRATPPDSNAPDLPPPFKPGTPSSDPAPVYQDIFEINTKT